MLKVDKCYIYKYKCKGLSYEQIIDQVLDNKIETYSYRGYIWSKDYELSRLLGKSNSYVNYHKKLGLTCEQIIDKTLDNEYKNNKEVIV